MASRGMARSPSRADLQRHPSTTALAQQVLPFRRARTIVERSIQLSPDSPKIVVPVRATRSAQSKSFNNSSSRRHNRNSQSRKAHPSESRYSNRSCRDKSSRQREVEVDDELTVPTALPPLPRQDASVYPNAFTRQNTSSLTQLHVMASASALKAVVPSPLLSSTTTQQVGPMSSPALVSATASRALWSGTLLLHTAFGIGHVVLAVLRQTVARTMPFQLPFFVTPSDNTGTAEQRLVVASCSLFASTHFGVLLARLLQQTRCFGARVRVAPAVMTVAAAASPAQNDQVQPFESVDSTNSVERNDLNSASAPKAQPIAAAASPSKWLQDYSQRLTNSVGSGRELVCLAFAKQHAVHRLVHLMLHTWLASFVSAQIDADAAWSHVHVAAIIISSWLPLVAQIRTMRKDANPSPSRLISEILSMVLPDAVAAVVVPIGLFALETTAVYDEYLPLSRRRASNDPHTAKALLNLRFATSLGPSVLRVLFGIHLLVVPHALATMPTIHVNLSMNQVHATPPDSKGVAVVTPRIAAKSSSLLSFVPVKATAFARKWTTKRASLLLLLLECCWGLAVMVCHAVAIARGRALPSDVCRARTLPWFTSTPSCAYVEIDCAIAAFQSQPRDLTGLLAHLQLDDNALLYLVISHCENLVVTPRIRDFTALGGFTLRHSSVTTWTSDASLSETHHPKLRALTLTDATMANDWTTSVDGNDLP